MMYLPVTSMRCASAGTLTVVAGADGDDLAVAGNDGRIRDGRLAGAIDHGCADKGERSSAAAGKLLAQLGERGHLVVRGAGDKLGQRRFVVVAHGLEVVELGVGRDQRGEIVIAVHPQRFHAPDQALHGVAFDLDIVPADVHGLASRDPES